MNTFKVYIWRNSSESNISKNKKQRYKLFRRVTPNNKESEALANITHGPKGNINNDLVERRGIIALVLTCTFLFAFTFRLRLRVRLRCVYVFVYVYIYVYVFVHV